MTFFALAAAAVAAAQPAAALAAIPEQAALTEQIRARDAAFFKLFFTGPCDPAGVRAFVTDDLEFYHEKAGFNARSGEEFVAGYSKYCSERQAPNAWRSRRELVPGSLHVDPIPGYGAMEVGEHVFYEKEGEKGQEKLVGRAKFAQVWVLGPDKVWRVSRVLSYAHGPAE